MTKSYRIRVPAGMYNEILRIKRQMEREYKTRYGKTKTFTVTRAASEYHRRRSKSFFGGGLL